MQLDSILSTKLFIMLLFRLLVSVLAVQVLQVPIPNYVFLSARVGGMLVTKEKIDLQVCI